MGKNYQTFVVLDAEVDCYRPTDVMSSTINVGNLIEFLQEFPDDLPVVFRFSKGYYYGRLDQERIKERRYRMDDDDE